MHLAPAGQPLPLDIKETAAAAGQWTLIEKKFYVDDVIDPAIVRDIRVFDPNYVPLLLKRLYRTPAGTLVQKQYHVIGRYIPNPTEDYKDAAIKLERVPPNFKFDPRKIHDLRTLEARWPGPGEEGGPTTEWRIGYPPAEVKVGRWLVDQLAAVQKFFDVGIELDKEGNQVGYTGQSTLKRMGQILEIEEQKDKERCEKAIAEARHQMRHDWRHFKKAIDEGRWGPDPQDPKPFLDLGAKPQTSEPPTEG